MTATCVYPGCDKPVRPVPRARYCSWEHMGDARIQREREARRKQRNAKREAARRAPPVVAAAVRAAPLPPNAFVDSPRADLDHGSLGRLPSPVTFALGASSLVAA